MADNSRKKNSTIAANLITVTDSLMFIVTTRVYVSSLNRKAKKAYLFLELRVNKKVKQLGPDPCGEF
jgi:hypothetical protein